MTSDDVLNTGSTAVPPPTGDRPAAGRWHLRGRLLPDAAVLAAAGVTARAWTPSVAEVAALPVRDLWIVDGRVTFDPVRDATTLTDAPTWILPGLVDMHCHVGLGRGGAIPPEVARTQAETDRDGGTLLIRDAGSAADTRWIDDEADLPTIIRAGRHIGRTRRYQRGYAEEIEPDRLVAEMAHQARRGDGWVKLVGDWIDRDLGDLGRCWPPEVLAAAVDAAHANGARVTAHVFGEDALPDLVAAGVDCLEHATALGTPRGRVVVEDLVTRGTAIVPTLVNIENFPAFAAAGAPKFPRYAEHMRELHRTRFDAVVAAWEAGVEVYAGTDAGSLVPHGIIAEEVVALHTAGLPAGAALGAASWRARAYLLEGLTANSDRKAPTGPRALVDPSPGAIGEGSPADLLVFDANPVADPAVARRPRHIILRGRPVGTGAR